MYFINEYIQINKIVFLIKLRESFFIKIDLNIIIYNCYYLMFNLFDLLSVAGKFQYYFIHEKQQVIR